MAHSYCRSTFKQNHVMIQTILIIIILTFSVLYIIRRISKAFKKDYSQCEGCPFKDIRNGKSAKTSAHCSLRHNKCSNRTEHKGKCVKK